MLRIHHLEVACYLLFFGKDPGVCDHIRSKVGACYLVSLFCKKDCKETGSTAHIQDFKFTITSLFFLNFCNCIFSFLAFILNFFFRT